MIRAARRLRLPALVAGASLAVAAPAAAQRTLSGALAVTRLEHRVSAGRGIERAAGTVIGGEILLTRARWLEVHGAARGGTLTAQSAEAEDRAMGEMGLDAAVLPFDWLAFRLGLDGRSYSTSLARQRWISVRTGTEARLEMLGGAVRGRAGLALMPLISVSGVGAPELALESGAAIAYRGRTMRAELAYSIERYDFPLAAGARRLEQVAGLTASIGVRVR